MKIIDLSEKIMVALYQNQNVKEQDHKHNAITAVRAAMALVEAQYDIATMGGKTPRGKQHAKVSIETLDRIQVRDLPSDLNSALARSPGEEPQVEVYSHPECIFTYCPHPELCKPGCFNKIRT